MERTGPSAYHVPQEGSIVNCTFFMVRRHAKVRLAAVEALWMIVKVPDRAKVKGAGTSAIVDLVGFREDNVLPVAAFYGRGDRSVNHLAEVNTIVRLCLTATTSLQQGDTHAQVYTCDASSGYPISSTCSTQAASYFSMRLFSPARDACS